MYICLNLDFYLIISEDYKCGNQSQIKSVMAQMSFTHAGKLCVIQFCELYPINTYSSRKWRSLEPFFKTNFGQLVISKSLDVPVKNNYVYNSEREFNCS